MSSDYTPPAADFSPADVVYQLLKDNNLLSYKGQGGKIFWKGYVGMMPASDEKDSESIEVVSILDTSPINEGYILSTGDDINQWGIQIRVRSSEFAYNRGWSQARKMAQFLTKTRNKLVTVDTVKYRYLSGWIASGPIPIGKEEDTRHHLFTVNPVINIAKG